MPRCGRILLFQHRDLLHSGDDVVRGVKYTMRTDLMYALESKTEVKNTDRFTQRVEKTTCTFEEAAFAVEVNDSSQPLRGGCQLTGVLAVSQIVCIHSRVMISSTLLGTRHSLHVTGSRKTPAWGGSRPGLTSDIFSPCFQALWLSSCLYNHFRCQKLVGVRRTDIQQYLQQHVALFARNFVCTSLLITGSTLINVQGRGLRESRAGWISERLKNQTQARLVCFCAC
nr:hypothetical protein CFP56_07790 [Quercus suber]